MIRIEALELPGTGFTFDPVENIDEPDFKQFDPNRAVAPIVDGIDFITGLPRRISNFADAFNDRLIEAGQRITSRGGDVAQSNLASNKITGIFTRAGQWVQKPRNAVLAVAIVVIAIFIIRK